MTNYIWLELKYGIPNREEIPLYRLRGTSLLAKAKTEALKELSDDVLLDRLKDRGLGILTQGHYDRLKNFLDVVIPDGRDKGYLARKDLEGVAR